MRLLRSLAPLALVAVLVTACNGSGSSTPQGGSTGGSTAGTSTLAASSGFEIRTVYARYAPGVPFGPQLPQALVQEMSSQTCPMQPRIVSGLLMECDTGRTVYLLKNPIVRGNVASATALQLGHQKIWYVEVRLAPQAAQVVAKEVRSMTGEQLAFSYSGAVLTSVAVDGSFHPAHFAITGNFDKANATVLAHDLAG